MVILIYSLITAPVPKVIFSTSILPDSPSKIILGIPFSSTFSEVKRVASILKPPIVPLAAEISPEKLPVAALSSPAKVPVAAVKLPAKLPVAACSSPLK